MTSQCLNECSYYPHLTLHSQKVLHVPRADNKNNRLPGTKDWNRNRNLPSSQCPKEQATSSQARGQGTPQTPCKSLSERSQPCFSSPRSGGRSLGNSDARFPFTSKQPPPRKCGCRSAGRKRPANTGVRARAAALLTAVFQEWPVLTGPARSQGLDQGQTGLLGRAGAEKWWSVGWCPRQGPSSVTSWELIPSSPQFRPGPSSKNKRGRIRTKLSSWAAQAFGKTSSSLRCHS